MKKKSPGDSKKNNKLKFLLLLTLFADKIDFSDYLTDEQDILRGNDENK